MASPGSSRKDRSWLRNALIGLLATVVGGVVVAWLIQDARFSPERRSTPAPTVSPTIVTPPTGVPSTPISPGMSYNGTIASGEVDTYSFVTSGPMVVYIRVDPVPYFLHRVQIHYREGGEIDSTANVYSYESTVLVFAPEPDVEYVIHVRGRDEASTGSYIIQMGESR